MRNRAQTTDLSDDFILQLVQSLGSRDE
jgi:hypothetical protein